MNNSTELQKKYERLEVLYGVSNLLHSTLDPHEVFNLIVGECVRLLKASSGSVVLVNPTTGLLEIEAAAGLTKQAAKIKLRPGEGVTGWVVQTGSIARIGDVKSDERY